jgi:hypothetical protein
MLTASSTESCATEVEIEKKTVPFSKNPFTLDGSRARLGRRRAKAGGKRREKRRGKEDHTRTMERKRRGRSLPLTEAFLGFLYRDQRL